VSTIVANQNPFGAAAPAIGYLYQCRYALWRLLIRSRTDAVAELSIERLDDIAFDQGTDQERLQTKHSIRRRASMSDASPDIWKTLRVWSEGIIAGTLDVPGAVLSLVTTAIAPNGGAAACLRPEGYGLSLRDPATALQLLEAVTQSSNTTQAEILASHKAFMNLTPEFDTLNWPLSML
jgi:hypothetical protein